MLSFVVRTSQLDSHDNFLFSSPMKALFQRFHRGGKDRETSLHLPPLPAWPPTPRPESVVSIKPLPDIRPLPDILPPTNPVPVPPSPDPAPRIIAALSPSLGDLAYLLSIECRGSLI